MSATWRCPIHGSTSSPLTAKSAQIIPTRITFVDIAGLVRGASKGEGLGNQFLANIREVDAVVHVLRCFEDDDITHVEGRIDPVGDADTVETELMLADLDSLERRIGAIEKKAKAGEKEAKEQFALMTKALTLLREGKPARSADLTPEEREPYRQLGLMTQKPVLYVANVEEGAAATGNAYSRLVEEKAKREGAGCVVISARIEEELAQLEAARTRGVSEQSRHRRTRPQPADPRRLCAARPHHLFYRRPEGNPRLDGDERIARAPGRRRHPYRFRKGLHSRRNHCL